MRIHILFVKYFYINSPYTPLYSSHDSAALGVNLIHTLPTYTVVVHIGKDEQVPQSVILYSLISSTSSIAMLNCDLALVTDLETKKGLSDRFLWGTMLFHKVSTLHYFQVHGKK
jgi:hypothetical protein